MNVIRHDYVTTNRNITMFAASRVFDERVVDRLVCKNLFSARRAKRNEIQWRIVDLKYALKSRRLSQTHFVITSSSCRRDGGSYNIIDSQPGK
ncbi:MAG: hypothetical protein ACXWF1_01525 [Chthoniobacterales bacterium]